MRCEYTGVGLGFCLQHHRLFQGSVERARLHVLRQGINFFSPQLLTSSHAELVGNISDGETVRPPTYKQMSSHVVHLTYRECTLVIRVR
jgi:hypothetical protein